MTVNGNGEGPRKYNGCFFEDLAVVAPIYLYKADLEYLTHPHRERIHFPL